jgi:hypothetical protein
MGKNQELYEAFEQAAKDNLWNDPDSKSGPGSNLGQTQVVREVLPHLLKQYYVKSMLDVPCGDFFWMKEIKQELSAILDKYVGGDIVFDLIERNNQIYSDGKISFQHIDITTDIVPKSDLIFTRDCFIHLSYQNIYKAINNYKKSNSTYLLVSTYTNPRKNFDVDGFYIHGRALNLQRFPFYFPKPLALINEKCTEGNGNYSDKSLALWRVRDISLYVLKLLVVLKSVKHKIKERFS